MTQKPNQDPIRDISYPPELPIVKCKDSIIKTVLRAPVTVVTGATGSGKTTQLPKICLEAARGERGIIGCTQPRRIAAVMAARRIASELNEEVGQTVGHKIRFDRRMGQNLKIKVMTDGILLMEAQSDPYLRQYDTLIIDEAHERSLNIDFLLGIVKKILPKRKDLKVIVTSATIDAAKFSEFFDQAPIIEVSGTMYPVETCFRPPLIPAEDEENLSYPEMAADLAEEIIFAWPEGDILIFLPTEADIRETCKILEGRIGTEAVILPLFARLSRQEQERAFRRYPRRKVIAATNIAETSLTIPDIRYVIDSGLARIKVYNPRIKTTSLPVAPISASGAIQRQGRCGRVQAGVCFRLYSEETYKNLPPYTQPELLRSNLAEVILRMLYLKLGRIESFPFLDQPASRHIQDGIDTLLELNAIEPVKQSSGSSPGKEGPDLRLTPKGQIMAVLPLDPRLGAMVIEAKRQNCLSEVIAIAAALTTGDPREVPFEKRKEAADIHGIFADPASDFMSLLNIWRLYGKTAETASKSQMKKFCQEHCLSFRRMKEWRDVYEQLSSILEENGYRQTPAAGDDDDLYERIHRSILSGYLSQAGLKKEKNIYQIAKGREAVIFPGSGLYGRGSQWIVAAELVKTSKLYARRVARIESLWLYELGRDLCRFKYSNPRWDETRQEAVADEQVSLFGLVIIPSRVVALGRVDQKAATEIFLREALVSESSSLRLPFLDHNRRVIEKIKGIEERLRRRDLFAGEEKVFEFYAERLPGIFNLRALRKVLKERGDEFLRLEEAGLLLKHPDEEELSLYPELITIGDKTLPIRYRFAPGRQDDGATLKIPLSLLAHLPKEINEAAIPGLWREKLQALLKGLPKETRKKLHPLKDTFRIVLEDFSPGKGSLSHNLSQFMKNRFGIDIPGSAWRDADLEERLRLRYALEDQQEKELVSGRDLDDLKRDFFSGGDHDLIGQARAGWEREGLTGWDFPGLPEMIPLQTGGQVVGYSFPALAKAEDKVCLRLFNSPGQAAVSHPEGVAALYRIVLRSDFDRLRKSLKPSSDLKLWADRFPGEKELVKGIEEKVARDLFGANIRDAEGFDRLRRERAARIIPRGLEILQAVAPLLKEHWQTSSIIADLERENGRIKPALDYLACLKEEIGDLLPGDFLSRYNLDQISRLVRYLKAQGIRARRGISNLKKAEEKSRLVRTYQDKWNAWQARLTPESPEELRRAVCDLFWTIQEFRVSLFAQELKTLFPVSEKRLIEKINELQKFG